ncbi:MAG: phosphatase PAP2 family protein [Myxococcales bacterium]|nr:phosphatase PAP2 family protein [Myxococcales bacterium]
MAAALALWVALAGPAVGAPTVDAPATSPAVDPAWAAAGAAAAGAGWLGVHLAHPGLVETSCPCARGEVNAFDRVAVDAALPGAEPWADGVAAVGLVAPVALAAALAPEGERLGDALLVVEAAAVAGLLTAGLKLAVGRPYPYMYRPAPWPEQNGDGVNYAAWPSGHTAAPMAAAVSFAVLQARRGRGPGWLWWTVGPALALAAGALQVGASNHFPSDVLGGALVGAGVGLAVPALHGVWP